MRGKDAEPLVAFSTYQSRDRLASCLCYHFGVVHIDFKPNTSNMHYKTKNPSRFSSLFWVNLLLKRLVAPSSFIIFLYIRLLYVLENVK